jgi:hypothetical protein
VARSYRGEMPHRLSRNSQRSPASAKRVTIAMLVIDPPFALAAADQQFTVEVWESTGGGREVSRGLHNKVMAHPTLSLVWVATGIGVLEARGEARLVNDLVRPPENWSISAESP